MGRRCSRASIDALARVVGAIEHRARADVLQLGPDERPALPRLHVLKVHHLVEVAVDLEYEAVPEIGRSCH